MLTISKSLSADQAQSYHQKEFTAKEQNYWSQRGVIAGDSVAETHGYQVKGFAPTSRAAGQLDCSHRSSGVRSRCSRR
jgi:hypothetical protein